MNPSSDGCKCYDETVRPCPVHPITHPTNTCPCGKIINEGDVTCKSCAPAYRAGMMRAAEIIRATAREYESIHHIEEACACYGCERAILKEAEKI